jgi:lysozyme family protein
MLPLIGLAATYVPELIRLIAGDKAGNLAGTVSSVVSDVTKTSDPVAALKVLQTDVAAESELRAKLAQIAVDAQKAQNEEADKQRADELSTLQANMANTQGARASMLALAQDKSGIAWGAPVVSLVVTVGFFFILALVIFDGAGIATGAAGSAVAQIVNISVGTLATGFATVVNFWLGSSQSSRSKDSAAVTAQAVNASQISDVLETVKSVTNTAITGAQTAGLIAPTVVAPVVAPVKADGFDRCVAVTLAYEGGFVEDPKDAGGATNFGITKRALETFLGKQVSVDDVKNLSSSTAIEIYRANYWNQMLCGSLPAGVDLMIFDYGVNSGPGRAIKDLQSIVGVPQDGAIGKITLPAVLKAPPEDVINKLAASRMAFLKTLDNWAHDGDGWTRRVNDVQQKALDFAGKKAPAAMV